MKLERIYKDKRPIGLYSSGLSGFYVMDVLYGIEEYLVTCDSNRKNYRKNKVFTSESGKYFIRKFNRRIYLTEILRT